MKSRTNNILKHILMVLVCIICIFPIYWMISSSFKTGSEIFNHSLFPAQLTFENYRIAFEAIPLQKMLINSIVVSLVGGFSQVFLAILFAYAFRRWKFKGSGLVFNLLSIAWLIPAQVIMIPNYIEIVNAGLHNTLIGIILPNMCAVFANFRMYQVFQSVPDALIEAARLDGANNRQILLDIILPNIKSMVFSLAIIQVIAAWNDYLWPNIVVATLDKAPVQIGLKTFLVPDNENWGAAMAASTISILPILIIYILMSRQIVNSFMKSGVK